MARTPHVPFGVMPDRALFALHRRFDDAVAHAATGALDLSAFGDAALTLAAEKGHKELVEFMLLCGYDVEARDRYGATGACGGRGAVAPTHSAQRS